MHACSQSYTQYRVLSTCTLHNIAGHFDHLVGLLPQIDQKKVWSDLFGKLCADSMVLCRTLHVGKHIHESTIASKPPTSLALIFSPAHTKPLLTQGTRNLYHTFTLSAHRRWALTMARGIEDATLPLGPSPIREPDSGTQDPWPLSIGDSAPARTTAYSTDRPVLVVARRVPHPTLPV